MLSEEQLSNQVFEVIEGSSPTVESRESIKIRCLQKPKYGVIVKLTCNSGSFDSDIICAGE